MITQIKKRDGSVVEYDLNKITNAILRANTETNEFLEDNIDTLVEDVDSLLEEKEETLTVECVQDTVEEVLLGSKYKDTAKAFILYRDKRDRERRRDIFKPRKELKPYEYPELLEYADAIRNSYWIHTEFNYTSDIQDFKQNVKPHERTAIKNAMLAIAQVEVAVKTFWGDLYHRMPKWETGAVGATFSESECYIEGTEILTPNGWVDFRDINNGDLVAQFNHDNTIEFVPARNKIVKDIDGKLHHLSKTTMDAYVTPNHNMVVYKKKENDKFDLIPSSKVSGRNSSYFIPQAGKLKGGNRDKLTPKERLYIALQSDGNFRFWTNKSGEKLPRGSKSGKQTYEISFKKDRKIKRFNDIVNSINDIKVSEYNVSREGYKKYSVDVDKDFNYKGYEWVDLSDKSWEWCEDFIKELVEWDGTRIKDKKDGNMSFSTVDKDVADKVQAIATMAGYRVVITDYEDNRSDSYSNCYKMVFVENRERVTGTYKKEEVDYKGKVYCVEVDSGAIVTRYNDKVLIAGNCRHADAYSHLLELLGLNEEFKHIDDIPALRERVDELTMHTKLSKSEDNRDYVLSVLLFSLFIEHVSLFSQFLIMMSFNKHKNLFRGLSNAIEATSKEEQIHGLFGIEIINILREEHPEWFDGEMKRTVYEACEHSYETEKKVLDWLYEDGELEFLPKRTVKEFIKNRLNNSLESIGFEKLFEIDEEVLAETAWFDDEVISTKLTDFLSKRSVNYTKFTNTVTEDTLFSSNSEFEENEEKLSKDKVNEILRMRMLTLGN